MATSSIEVPRSGAVNSNSPVNRGAFATTAFDRLRILEQARTIAMVGLSANPFRPSHFAAIYMLAEGYNVIPVNPRETEILGRTAIRRYEIFQSRWTSSISSATRRPSRRWSRMPLPSGRRSSGCSWG